MPVGLRACSPSRGALLHDAVADDRVNKTQWNCAHGSLLHLLQKVMPGLKNEMPSHGPENRVTAVHTAPVPIKKTAGFCQRERAGGQGRACTPTPFQVKEGRVPRSPFARGSKTSSPAFSYFFYNLIIKSYLFNGTSSDVFSHPRARFTSSHTLSGCSGSSI